MDPAFPHAHMIEFAYAGKGMYTEALANIEDGKRMTGSGPWYWAAKARIYGQRGQEAQALDVLNKLKEMSKKSSLNAAPIAWAHLGIGHREERLKWLEKAYEQRSNSMTALKVDPTYDSLRKDARFQELLRRVGLGE
jgi:tetratricopeptide (TPR) repeat protein